jgi:glyoxylase-like metal-dependent hydrolase (beta-lactamase superfamily II)
VVRIRIALVLAVATVGTLSAGQKQDRQAAVAIVNGAIAALGGEQRFAALTAIQLDTIGHEWALEQSERPEGPWLAHYVQRSEIADVANQRLRRTSQTRDWNFAQWSPAAPIATVIADNAAARTDGTRWAPGSPRDVGDAKESLALAPERLLFTARDAADLRTAPGKTLQGVAQDAVAFTWSGSAVTLYLNRFTHFPTMLEILRDDSNEAYGIWGDITERRWYSFWVLEKAIWYPRQTTVERNGLPFRDTTVMALKVNEPIDETLLTIAPETIQAFRSAPPRASGLASLQLDPTKAIELAPDVVQLPGSWNVILVKQPDGVVVIEGPISPAYTTQVIDAAGKRFPGAPIKAVVTTSDAWPHIGGLREYVARKVPIYALDLNVAIIERLVKAPRSLSPDALARRPVAAVIRPVAERTTIGSGPSRVEVFPVRGETGERMMLAWLPSLNMLYTSDLVQPNRPSGFFMPGMIDEVMWAVAREKIAPQRAVGMHLPSTPWSALVEAVAAVHK